MNHRLRIVRFSLLLLLVSSLFAAPAATEAEQVYTPTPIYRIQGDGATSPLAERWVDAVGVVTGLSVAGFYLQEPVGDGDQNTSDGIYVYTYDEPMVTPGQCVRVQGGLVTEFYGKTELSRMRAVTADASCATTTLAPVRVLLPYLGAAPADLYERYEGMLVEFVGLEGVVQGPTKHLRDGRAELALVAETLAPYLPASRVFQAHSAATAALIHLSGAQGVAIPAASWGDRIRVGEPVDGVLRGVAVVDFNFDKYQLVLLPETPINLEKRPAAEEQSSTALADEFTLCSMNLYALGRGKMQITDDVTYRAHLHQQALVINERLQGCTVIGLQETGAPEDAAALAATLGEVFKLPYEATALPGPQTADPDFPLTNSLLTRSDRVQVLAAAAPQACSAQDYAVPSAPGECPEGFFALFDRTPLVVDLSVTGDWSEPYPLRVIVNHLKSKAGDEAANSIRRTHQATFVAMLVQETLTANDGAHVAVLGDLNDYYGSRPVETLRTGVQPPLIHTFDLLPELDRYTYIFNGASQVLDHILLTASMAPALAEVDILHINVDFPYPTQVDFTQVHHASDHEPIRLRIRPGEAAVAGGKLRYPGLRVTLLDQAQRELGVTMTDALGEFRFWGLQPGGVTLRIEAPNSVTLSSPDMTLSLQPGYNALYAPVSGHQSAALGSSAAWIGHGLAEAAAAEQ